MKEDPQEQAESELKSDLRGIETLNGRDMWGLILAEVKIRP